MNLLTAGAIKGCLQGEKIPSFHVQILQIKGVVGPNTPANIPTRYKLLIADGKDHIGAICATQLNAEMNAGTFKQFSVVNVSNYSLSDVQGQKIMIVMGMELVAEKQAQIPNISIEQDGYRTGATGPTRATAPGGAGATGTTSTTSVAAAIAASGRPPMAPGATGIAYTSPVAANPYNSPAVTRPHQQKHYTPSQATQPMHQTPVPQQQQQPRDYQAPLPAASAAANPYGQQQQPRAQQHPQQQQQPYATATINPYGQPPQQQPQQQQQEPPQPAPYGVGAAAVGGGYNNPPTPRADAASMEHTVPINAINPYSSRCTITARITAKSDIRSWSNAKGEGCLFSVDLLDANGGEIRGTFFKEACDKFFPVLQEGKVYTMTGFKAKLVQNKQYSSLKNNYEITFDLNSDIRAAPEDAAIPAQHYQFAKIALLPELETNSNVDVVAYVRHASEPTEIVTKKGNTMLKREITLVDDLMAEVRMTVWGEKAQEAINYEACPIIAFKGVRVGDYGGRSLSMSMNSGWAVNPDVPEAHALHAWKMAQHGGVVPHGTHLLSSGGMGDNAPAVAFEDRTGIASIKEQHLGDKDKADFVTVKATVSYIKHDNDPWYPACPSEGCNKKVVESMNGDWHCEKCNQTFPECKRRYILSLVLTDHTGNTWFSCFNDIAKNLLQVPAQALYEMRIEGDEQRTNAVFKTPLFNEYVAKVRVKVEQVQDEQRQKATIVKMEPVDCVQECKSMLEAIARYP